MHKLTKLSVIIFNILLIIYSIKEFIVDCNDNRGTSKQPSKRKR